jgi:outer membrane translocation and assembly module TamA
VPLGSLVWANRASIGSVIASDPLKVPFSRRYFLGGATSLRGWGRYQVGPLDENGMAIGGRTRVLMSTELRFPLNRNLSTLFFVDAGQVGSADLSVERLRMRVDFGPGLRYRTPIGAVSADLGIQLNPIQGLRINGAPEPRHWRLHLGIGQTF